MQLTRTRKMPYTLGVRWQELVIFPSGILFLGYALFGGGFSWASKRSIFFWVDLALLGLGLTLFMGSLLKRVKFSEDQIVYSFIGMHRRFRYDELRSIRANSTYSLSVRFEFLNGESFKADLGYDDVDYLMEILKDRAPNVLKDVATLRNSRTRGMRRSP